MLRRYMRGLALGVTLAGVLSSGRSEAAPIEASASASAAAADDARELAIETARHNALELALDSMEIELDEAAVAQVREHPGAWTGAYRILEVTPASGGVEVRVEVEIDLPRLRKRVAKRSGTRPRGFNFGGLRVSDCGSVDEAALTQPLRVYGILADGGAGVLSISLQCKQQGIVEHTHAHAVAVELEARVEGQPELDSDASTQGFASSVEEATSIALERAIAELADELAIAARGELELRVEQPWPASRLSSLERVLRNSVIGVDAVELAGIDEDGSARLRIGGNIDAKGLASGLQEASFSGFSLVGLRIDGAHALSVRMQ